MRETWHNVYAGPYGTGQIQSYGHRSRDAAISFAIKSLRDYGKTATDRLAYVVRVREKPEGAPKRYISPEQRAAYETKQWPEINAYQRSLGL